MMIERWKLLLLGVALVYNIHTDLFYTPGKFDSVPLFINWPLEPARSLDNMI